MRHLQHLRALGRRPAPIQTLGLALVLSATTFWLSSPPSPAAPYTDPVEELKRALQLDSSISTDADVREKQKQLRSKNLEEQAARLKSLGDLTRALLLLE